MKQLTNSEILNAFENDRLDVGFCRLPLTVPDDLEPHVLLEEEYLLAFSGEHTGADIKDLLSLPVVIFPREKAAEMHEDIMAIFSHYSVTPKILYEATEQLTLLGMVSTGLGIAIIPESARYSNLPGVSYLSFPDIALRSRLALLSQKKSDKIVQNFVGNATKEDLFSGRT